MSRIRARVERLERGHGAIPPAVQLALRRMQAREALYKAARLQVAARIEAYLATEEDRPAKPVEPARYQAHRFERAKQLLGGDDHARHAADRDAVLDWELRERGGRPGRFARLWGRRLAAASLHGDPGRTRREVLSQSREEVEN